MSENVRRYGAVTKPMMVARKNLEKRFGKGDADFRAELRELERRRKEARDLGAVPRHVRERAESETKRAEAEVTFRLPDLPPGLNYSGSGAPPALGIPAAIAGLDEVLGDVLAALDRLEERLAPMMLPESGGKEQGEVPRPVMSQLAFEITQRTDVARGVRGKLLTLLDRLDM